MKSYVKQLLATVLVLGSAAATANDIRVIGRGGGMSEMEALTFFDQLPDLIEFCADAAHNFCGLEDQELRILEKTLSLRNRYPKRLAFDANMESFRIRADGTLEVSNKDLNGVFLFTTVIQATLDNESFKPQTAKYILESQKISAETFSLRRLTTDDAAPNLIVFYGEFGSFVQLKVDGVKTSIHWDILEALECPKKEKTKLLKLENVHAEGTGFLARATWKCGDQIYRAKLVSQRYERSTTPLFRFRTFSRESLDCPDFLSRN